MSVDESPYRKRLGVKPMPLGAPRSFLWDRSKDWREPFASVLVLLEVLSFDVDMLSMNCVASLNSVALFGFRCLMIPMLMPPGCFTEHDVSQLQTLS